MRQREQWQPTKFTQSTHGWQANPDPREVGVGSRLFADAVARFYADAVPQHAKGRLADLGCGKVPLYGVYAPHVDSVICADWPGSLHGTPHLDFFVDLGAPLPVADARFDTVLLSDVLEHVPAPAALCNELARILAPGGTLLLNTPFLYWVHEAPHDYYRYTAFALRRLCEDAGLIVHDIRPLGGSAEVLGDFVAKHLARAPGVGRVAAGAWQMPFRALSRSRLGARLSDKSGALFPLGFGVIAQKPV